MSVSIRTYIITRLQEAFAKSFSFVKPLPSVPVTLSTISPDVSVDIATPFPLIVSRSLDIPVSRVSSQLLENFHFDSNILINSPSDLYNSGFFNFRLSRLFIFRVVYETGLCNVPLIQKISANTFDVISKIHGLLQRYSSEKMPSYKHFICHAMKSGDPEFQFSRHIAVTDANAVHSDGARAYFINLLTADARSFYKSCPIQTNDSQLTLFRIIILKALFNRIMSLQL